MEQKNQELWNNCKMCNLSEIGIPERKKKEKKTEEIPEEIMIENFLQINVRHKTAYPESSEITKRINVKKLNLEYHIYTSENQK